MHLDREAIQRADKIYRLNLINSITGIKPANLIGTRSPIGESNLAIFSSVTHLGSNPAILGFVLRPDLNERRHTYENILATRTYTINQVPSDRIPQAHYTSAKFDANESEFEKCEFTEEELYEFPAPFVKESSIKLGMSLLQTIPIEINGTLLVIGKVEHLIVPEESVSENGYIDLEKSCSVGVSGLNTYYTFRKVAELPYARASELPNFS